MDNIKVNWDDIKIDYITDEKSSYRKIADKYGVSLGTVYDRAKKEGWFEQKKQHKDRVIAMALRNIETEEAKRIKRILSVSDKFLAKIEDIADEKTPITPSNIDILVGSLKKIMDMSRSDRDSDDSVHVDVVFDGDGEDYAG